MARCYCKTRMLSWLRKYSAQKFISDSVTRNYLFTKHGTTTGLFSSSVRMLKMIGLSTI